MREPFQKVPQWITLVSKHLSTSSSFFGSSNLGGPHGASDRWLQNSLLQIRRQRAAGQVHSDQDEPRPMPAKLKQKGVWLKNKYIGDPEPLLFIVSFCPHFSHTPMGDGSWDSTNEQSGHHHQQFYFPSSHPKLVKRADSKPSPRPKKSSPLLAETTK